ncbi:MAG: S-layer homology domain-containing protein [Firmicutes bacterium]|nr:S-layer homology domain-containing protein [Bacillota bacterium]
MRTTRKIITLIAALALIFASVVPAFAAEFSDLEGHWSKQFMEKLVEKGIMAGYADGTIKPDRTVTAAEAFVMLANLYDLNDAAKEEVYKDYGPAVEEASDVSWANKQLAICLAAGIFTESEMKNITFASEMPKQNLAVYMVRAIKKAAEAEKLAEAELEYKDAADITSKCLGSIALLTEMGVVSGDSNGNFTPKASVTRGVFATMLCNIIDYLDKENITLKLDDYLGLDSAEGFLSSVSDSAIVIRGMDGIYRSYPRDAQLKSTVNGAEKALSSGLAGNNIKLQIDEEGKAVTAAVTEEANVTYKQGRLNTLATNTVSAKLVDLYTGESGAYVLSSAKITQDGKEVSFADLKKGAFLTLKIEKGTVTEVTADTKEYTVSGQVGPVNYDSTVTMILKEAKKADAVLYMDLADMPTIKRGSLNITVDRLSEGEDIKVTIKGGEVTRIDTQGKDATMTGQLTIITRTINDTTWTVKGEDGTSATYILDPSAAAFSGETAIKLDTINPGDEVSIIVTSGIITEVSLKKAAAPATEKLTAEILAVDPSNRILTVLKEGKLTYINCKKAASILDSETGKTLSFSALAAGDMIVAYGAYTDSTNFAATSIIIELKH